MRLIDADELEEKLADNKTIWYFNLQHDGILKDIIDNAPTVEIPNTSDNEVKQPCRKFYFADCIKEDCPYYEDCDHKRPKIERQHGKWVAHNFYVECNQCRVWFLKSHLIRKSFCPNCGAEQI